MEHSQKLVFWKQKEIKTFNFVPYYPYTPELIFDEAMFDFITPLWHIWTYRQSSRSQITWAQPASGHTFLVGFRCMGPG